MDAAATPPAAFARLDEIGAKLDSLTGKAGADLFAFELDVSIVSVDPAKLKRIEQAAELERSANIDPCLGKIDGDRFLVPARPCGYPVERVEPLDRYAKIAAAIDEGEPRAECQRARCRIGDMT